MTANTTRELHTPLDTATAIRTRRSVPFGKLASEQPDILEATLWALLEAAHWAPNHGNTQPWRFGVYTGAGRKRLAEALANGLAAHKGVTDAGELAAMHAAQQETQAKAPAWVVAAAKTPAEGSKFPPHEEDWATAAAIQNLLLAARAHGLGSKWITNAAIMHPSTLPALGFEEGCRPLGLLFLAHVQEWPEGRRDPVASRVMWVRE